MRSLWIQTNLIMLGHFYVLCYFYLVSESKLNMLILLYFYLTIPLDSLLF